MVTDFSPYEVDLSGQSFEERMSTLKVIKESFEDKDEGFVSPSLLDINSLSQKNRPDEYGFDLAPMISERSNYSLTLSGNAEMLWRYENLNLHEGIEVDFLDDVNGDRAFDILLYDEHDGGHLYLLSGRDGSIIWHKEYKCWTFGGRYDDLNSDGIAELVVVDRYDHNNKELILFSVLSGKNGNLLNEFEIELEQSESINPFISYEHSDLTGDGIGEVFLKIEYEYENNLSYSVDSKIIVIDPAVCSIVWNVSIPGIIWIERFSLDCNGDGIDDPLITYYDNEYNHYITLLSGFDGRVILDSLSCGYGFSKDTDVDADGLPDVILGISEYNSCSYVYDNRIVALKGTDGTQIWSVPCSNSDYMNFNFDAFGEDVNSDGIKDIVAGIDNSISLLSGKDGSQIWTTNNVAHFVIYTKAVNNDGIDDVCLVSSDWNGSFGITVLNGVDGRLIWKYTGSTTYDFSVDFEDDIDGDNKDDVFISTVKLQDGTIYTTLKVLSGANGRLVWMNSYPINIDQDILDEGFVGKYAYAWTHCGHDFNGDATKDPVVELEFYFSDGYDYYTIGMVLVADGNTGNEIWNAQFTSDGWTGFRITCYGFDLNRNGIGDIFFSTDKGAYAVTTATVPVNRAPVASFFADTVNGEVPLEVQFTDSSSRAPTSWSWDFGDGSSSTLQDPLHTYGEVGNYTVSLQVSNNYGSDITTKINYISVTEPNSIPIASIINITPDPAVEGRSVFFEGEGHDTDGTVIGYKWTSSIDGELSSSSIFNTSDLSIGIHTIYFSVKDDDGAWSDPISETLEVRDEKAPDVYISATQVSNISVNAPVTIHLNSTDAHPAFTELVIKDSRGQRIVNLTVSDEVADGSAFEYVWNATFSNHTAVPSGIYNIVVNSTDESGNQASSNVSIVVDNTRPEINIIDIKGSGSENGFVYSNSVIAINAMADTDVTSVSFTMRSAFTNFFRKADANFTNGSWSASFNLSDVPDDGIYLINVTATDAANNTNSTLSGTGVQVDREAPLLYTQSEFNGTHIIVNISSSEALSGGPRLTINSEIVLLEDTSNGWSGSYDRGINSTFLISAKGSDLAGNIGAVDSRMSVEVIETDNNTATFTSPESGASITFRTTNETTSNATITESFQQMVNMTDGSIGLYFVDVDPGSGLEDNFSNATIRIPINESTLPAGIDINDVSICYYNGTSGEWEAVTTTVESINGLDHWVAHVSHFSIYAAIAGDNVAPELDSVNPSAGLKFENGTTFVNIRFNYSDLLSGINVSSVIFKFNGVEINNSANLEITSCYVSYNATDLSSGSYIASMNVADNANNIATFETSFSIATKVNNNNGGSPSGGGGGGGSGNTGESFENIIAKDRKSCNVFIGETSRYEFDEEISNVSYVQFKGTTNAGKISTLIEILKDTSALVDSPAPGNVYQNLNIWVGNAAFGADKIEDAVIGFRISKAWLTENGFDGSDVVLYRYNDGWTGLSTQKISEDEEYVYFEAQTSGFSSFAMSATDDEGRINGAGKRSSPEDEALDGNPAGETPDEGPRSIPESSVLLTSGILLLVALLLRRMD